jgi:hypothetical protein
LIAWVNIYMDLWRRKHRFLIFLSFEQCDLYIENIGNRF